MSQAHKPSWLDEDGGASDDPSKPIAGGQSTSTTGSSNILAPLSNMSLDKRQTYFYWFLKSVTMGEYSICPQSVSILLLIILIIIIGGCALMLATAATGLTYMNSITDVAKIFIALFIFLFSGGLFLFEASQIRRCESVDHMFKRNFGFLYSAKGKAFYIVL